MTPDGEAMRAMLEHMKSQGRRHFNEQLASVQESTGSSPRDIFNDLIALGLPEEAKSYRAYVEERAIKARRDSLRHKMHTPSFVMAENELASHLRDSTVNNNLPWIGVTDLHNIAQDLLMRGWTKAVDNEGETS